MTSDNKNAENKDHYVRNVRKYRPKSVRVFQVLEKIIHNPDFYISNSFQRSQAFFRCSL